MLPADGLAAPLPDAIVLGVNQFDLHEVVERCAKRNLTCGSPAAPSAPDGLIAALAQEGARTSAVRLGLNVSYWRRADPKGLVS